MTTTQPVFNKVLRHSFTEDVGNPTFLKSHFVETIWPDNLKVDLTGRIRIAEKSTSTNPEGEPVQSDSIGTMPVDRMYPHVFDENKNAGQVLLLLRNAINDVQNAIEAFGEPDFQAVSTRLTQVAATMGKAHELTAFNESLGGVVSFIRRAMLAASVTELSRSGLNMLAHSLESIYANPMLDLEDASDLVDKLEQENWRGEHRLANELILALMEDSDLTVDDLQALLFPGLEVIEE